MEEEKFWQLLSSKLTGEASVKELEALDKMLQEHPAFALKAQMLSQMWTKHDKALSDTDDFYNRHLQRLSNRPDIFAIPEENNYSAQQPLPEVPPSYRKRWRWTVSVIAAASLAVCAIIYNGRSKHESRNIHPAQNTVSTRKGSKSNVLLPDGSAAWLNADSRLTYNENFGGSYREVSLEGEAYFDVVKDKTKPFIIHTKSIDIRVIGTAFNVRAYDNEKNTETALFRGSVEVTLHNSPEKKIILKPNEKLLVNNKTLADSSSRAPARQVTATQTAAMSIVSVHREPKDSSAWETLWIKNKLVFDAESLEQAAKKIERWYDVKVIIRGDEELKQTTYSAIFESETLLQVLEALKITGNFTYSIKKDVVTIK